MLKCSTYNAPKSLLSLDYTDDKELRMAGNASLHNAKKEKNDEFYTQLSDIEQEMKHYKEQFKGKTIFCNCDDPYESNFFKYFAMNFNYLGLKKLIATCYVSSPVMYTQLSLFDDMEQSVVDPKKKPYKVEITEVGDENGDGAFDLDDIKQLLKNKKNVCKVLKGDGDFRSDECIELLKEADIVVTNPPFSLFREYIAQLTEYKKKFIVIGNLNATHYKEIFPLIRDNKMWLGYGFQGGNAYFSIPSSNKTDYAAGVYNPDTGLVKFRNCAWFTNLDIQKRHEDLILYKQYNPEEYPRYENFDAIDVNSVKAIPCDYYDVMGVPINFLEVHNPEQFEILGLAHGNLGVELGIRPYDRSLKPLNKGLRDGDFYYMKDGKPQIPFIRIAIRRKEQPT